MTLPPFGRASRYAAYPGEDSTGRTLVLHRCRNNKKNLRIVDHPVLGILSAKFPCLTPDNRGAITAALHEIFPVFTTTGSADIRANTEVRASLRVDCLNDMFSTNRLFGKEPGD